jgi:hypothetical protein
MDFCHSVDICRGIVRGYVTIPTANNDNDQPARMSCNGQLIAGTVHHITITTMVHQMIIRT